MLGIRTSLGSTVETFECLLDVHLAKCDLFTSGKIWLPGQAGFQKTEGEKFQLGFEAIRGDGVLSDIAIDGIVVYKGACSNQGLCTFDYGPCTWVQMTAPDDEGDWILHKVIGPFVVPSLLGYLASNLNLLLL